MTFGEYVALVKDIGVTTLKGMAVTWRVFMKVQTKGAVTIQYPETRDRLPMGSRGLLFNDVEDCIACKQCATACPVDCIYIEADKKAAGAEIDSTKGGVKKTLDLKRFDIDVSLCCYCGLCSAACPTECLYHTKEYEYSKFERDRFTFDFLNWHH
ncbi:MAG: 4Fe-4S binding protein [Bdellovibrionales bacterium]|nr:4Fe-4S binding protein [Bdellovibrionales bacterium]